MKGTKDRWDRDRDRGREVKERGMRGKGEGKGEGGSFRSKTSRDLQLVVEQSACVSGALFRCVLMMPHVAPPRREDSEAGPDGFRPSQADDPPLQPSGRLRSFLHQNDKVTDIYCVLP